MGNLGVEHNYKFLPTRVGVNANLQRFSIAQGAGTHCLCDISVIREDLPEGKTLIGTYAGSHNSEKYSGPSKKD